MKNRLSVSAVVSSIILTACGGGGGGTETKSTASSAPVTSQQAVEPVELLNSQPIILPDLKAKYDRLCGRKTNAQSVVSVDVNKDNKLDIIVALSCLRPDSERGKPYDGDVPNGLIALVQDSSGKFVDKTQDVFGNDLPSIGGIGIDYKTADFNGDGVKDIVFAVNREDGRLPDNRALNHKASQVALMSDGNGKYKITTFTSPEYGYRIALKENTYGKQDLITIPFEEPNAYTYDNGWKKISGYDWISNVSTTFFKSVSPGLGSSIAVVPSSWPRTGVELWNGTNHSWRKVGEYKFPEPTLVYMKSWTGGTGLVPMFKLDGKDFVTPSIADTCELKRTTNGNKEALAIFAANEVVGGYTGQTLDESDTKSLRGMYKALLFDLNTGNVLSKIDLPISNEVDHGTLWKTECEDLNGDGLDEILYYQPQGGPPSGGEVFYPAIFLNDGKGNYNRVSTKWFPRPGNGTSFVYDDFNNDGIKDLLYFPLSGYDGPDTDNGVLKYGHLIQSNSVTYHLHIGLRKLKTSDGI